MSPTTCSPTSRARSTTTSSSGESDPLAGDGDDVLVAVWVTPRATRSEVVGVAAGRVRVRVAAVTEGGRANRELCRLLARELQVAPSRVTVQSGAASRRKLVRFAEVSVAAARGAFDL